MSAQAAPRLINYQGKLTNLAGQPVTTAVDITFTFFDAATDGTQLGAFSDTDTVTPDTNGLYSTLIGDDPENLVPDAVFAGESVWLNVAVQGENLVPRKRITSTGYALRSDYATTAAQAASARTVNGGLVGRMNYVAAEAIQPGWPVLLRPDGKIQHAKNFYPEYLTRSGTAFTSSPASVGSIASTLVAPNKAFIAYRRDSAALAMVATYEGGTMVSFGAPATFCNVIGGKIAVATIGADKALIVYMDAAAIKIRALVATVSGSAVTLGSPTDLPPHTFPDQDHFAFDVAPVGPGKFLFAYSPSEQGNNRVVVATISGEAINFGTPQDLGTGQIAFRTLAPVGTDKAILSYYEYLDYSPKAMVLATSGMTVTTGPVTLMGEAFHPIPYGVPLAPDKALFVQDSGKAVVLTASGTNLTSGTPVNIGACGPMTQMAADKFYMVSDNKRSIGSVSGTVPTVTSSDRFDNPVFAGVPLALSADTALIAYGGGSPYAGRVKIIKDADVGGFDERAFDTVIGVAEATAATGESCLVTVFGGVTEQFSGLTPFTTYKVDPNGVVNSSSGQNIGKAIGTNRLLIKVPE